MVCAVRPLSKDDYLQLLDPAVEVEEPQRHDANGITQAWIITKGGSGQQGIPEEEKVSLHVHE